MMTFDGRLNSARVGLRLAIGLVPILAGADKFFNILADWPAYLSPWVAASLPFSPAVLFSAIGVIEIAVGVAVFSRWTVVASYVAAGWLVGIAANLVLAGFPDIAVRDAVMAVAAYALGRLTEVHDTARVPVEVAPRQAVVQRAA